MEKKDRPFGGKIIEVKEIDRNGIPIGIIKGYIATCDKDRSDDRFIRGAFAKSIGELKGLGKKMLPFKDVHGRTIGGFPMETLIEDDKGLLATGEVNLTVQQGKEAHSLAMQGVYDSFSAGFTTIKARFEGIIRVIEEALIWEGSILDIPANPNAAVLEVKGAVPYDDLPLASRSRPWDADAAKARVAGGSLDASDLAMKEAEQDALADQALEEFLSDEEPDDPGPPLTLPDFTQERESAPVSRPRKDDNEQ